MDFLKHIYLEKDNRIPQWLIVIIAIVLGSGLRLGVDDKIPAQSVNSFIFWCVFYYLLLNVLIAPLTALFRLIVNKFRKTEK